MAMNYQTLRQTLTKPVKISGWFSSISTSSTHDCPENVTFAPVELGRMTKEEADKLAGCF